MSGESIISILGSPLLKGSEWLKGGAPSRGFGGYGGFFGGRGGGGFSKGKKLKQVELVFHQSGDSMVDVKYATTSQKMTFSLSFNTKNAVAYVAERASRYDY